MPTCYFFKDGQIVKEYPNWNAYCNDDSFIPEKDTYHWEVGDSRILEYLEGGTVGVDMDKVPIEVQTLILLLG